MSNLPQSAGEDVDAHALRGRLYLECDCSYKGHLVVVEWYEWDHERSDRHELLITAQLDPERGFWKRLWGGVVYAFRGRVCRFGHWSTAIVRPGDAEKLLELTAAYLAAAAREDTKGVACGGAGVVVPRRAKAP